MKRKKITKFLDILIIVLTLVLIILGITKLPLQMKESHARSFAREQCEYAQHELHDGVSPEKVRALTQARITEEHAQNTDIEFTKYTLVIDEENKTCRVDIELAYGKTYEKFSSKELSY